MFRRLTKKAARIIAKNLVLAKSLHTIDLSCNPFTPHEALQILLSLENYQVKLKELLMDFIEVNKDFAQVSKVLYILILGTET